MRRIHSSLHENVAHSSAFRGVPARGFAGRMQSSSVPEPVPVPTDAAACSGPDLGESHLGPIYPLPVHVDATGDEAPCQEQIKIHYSNRNMGHSVLIRTCIAITHKYCFISWRYLKDAVYMYIYYRNI